MCPPTRELETTTKIKKRGEHWYQKKRIKRKRNIKNENKTLVIFSAWLTSKAAAATLQKVPYALQTGKPVCNNNMGIIRRNPFSLSQTHLIITSLCPFYNLSNRLNMKGSKERGDMWLKIVKAEAPGDFVNMPSVIFLKRYVTATKDEKDWVERAKRDQIMVCTRSHMGRNVKP